MKVKCSIYRVVDKKYEDREYSVVECGSPDCGIFRASVSRDVGDTARDLMQFDSCTMVFELYSNVDFRPAVRVVGFEI